MIQTNLFALAGFVGALAASAPVTFAGVAILMCSAASAGDAVPLRVDHPALGIWEWVIPGAGCTEVMTLRADGTSGVTSGEEVSESESRISDQPDAGGFYRLIDKITRTNGKPDCAGQLTPIGDVATTYLKLNSDGDKLMLCLSRKGACFGPYIRRRP